MTIYNIQVDILNELRKAKRKFKHWPSDPLHALAVVGEEFGELQKDVLQCVYEPEKTTIENLRKEAIQTGAMILRFIDSLDRNKYVFHYSEQHDQEE